LVERLEAGDDLTPMLSRRVATAWIEAHPSQPMQHSDHLDILLNGWGIHHFHLREGGRDDDLLLAIMRPEDAHVIAVGDHRSFDDESLLEDAIRAWPHLFHASEFVIGLEQSNRGHLADLRNHGVSTFIEVDGKVYIPPDIGITPTGTPLHATERSNVVMHVLYSLSGDQAYVQLRQFFKAQVDPADVRVDVRDGHVWLVHPVGSVAIS
jgi:hypothetical protein